MKDYSMILHARSLALIASSLFITSVIAMEHPEPEEQSRQPISSVLSKWLDATNIDLPPLIGDFDQVKSLQQEELEQCFVQAVKNNDESVAKLCLERGIDPHTGAIFSGSESAVLLIPLAAEKVKKLATTFEATATMLPLGSLHLAAFFGSTEIAELLLNCGVYVDDKAAFGMTALHWASSEGNKEIAQLLLRRQASINAKDTSTGMKPIHVAANRGHVAIVELLLEHGAEVNDRADNNTTPLHQAIIGGHLDTVEFLARNSADVNLDQQGLYPLHMAIASKVSEEIRVKMVEILLKHKANIHACSADGHQPMHFAVYSNSPAVAQVLFGSGANIYAQDATGLKPIDMIRSEGYVDLYSWMYHNRKVTSNQIIEQPKRAQNIDEAISNGDIDFIKRFLREKYIQPQEEKIPGLTSMHAAAMYGNVEIGKLLVHNGAKIDDMIDGFSDKRTQPIHFATIYGNLQFLQWLVSCGANVNCPTVVRTQSGMFKFGKTQLLIEPIHIAANNGHLEIVQWLVNNGVDISTPDENGCQPIHWAVERGQNDFVLEERIKLIEWLIAHGANINAKNKKGKRPIDYAKLYKRQQLVDWLKLIGSKDQGSCLIN